MVAVEKGIKITASPDGRLLLEAVGFRGGTCTQALGSLAAALALQDGEESLKPEYFEARGEPRLNLAGEAE